MGNFKIKVDTPEESKEVQDLLVKMGYHARKNWTQRNPIHESIQAWSDGEFTFSLNHNRVPVGFKEITLPELRAMVKPVKEYLDKQEDGTYKLITVSSGCADRDWIEVPEGAIRARFYPHDPDGLEFENSNHQWWHGGNKEWSYYADYAGSVEYSRVVWQRTPSLKDQYAEIEQVRQTEIHGTVKSKSAWDTQIGGIHYKQFKIQPMQFALENKLDAAQQNVIKYIMRHSFKNGKQDLEKAKHYIDLMIEFYYGDPSHIDS